MVKNPYPGKFIVFEGLDGAGKSTQAALLVHYLRTLKIKAGATFEPTQSMIGGLIRSALSGDWKCAPECLQLLFAADRAYHIEKSMAPMLEKGINVISDRYLFSSLAYGAESGDIDWLSQVNSKFIAPDLVIYLDITPATCVQRMSEQRYSVELFEKEKMLEIVSQNYKKVFSRYQSQVSIVSINGANAPDQVFEDVKLTAASLFK